MLHIFRLLAAILTVTALAQAPAQADHLKALENLGCPTEGPIRCGDISIYREQNGTNFMREYHGQDRHGNHHFTDRLKDGYRALYVFDRKMRLMQSGTFTHVPNNGMPLIGLTARQETTSTYQVFKQDILWADVEKTCIAGSDLKIVPANTFPSNVMDCTSQYTYADGTIDTRLDRYWFFVPSGQVVSNSSSNLSALGSWGGDMIAYFPVAR